LANFGEFHFRTRVNKVKGDVRMNAESRMAGLLPRLSSVS
jgi:hypothetical protein